MSTTTPTDAAMASPVPLEVLRARAYLSRVAEPPAPALGALVEAIGPVDAAQLVPRGRHRGTPTRCPRRWPPRPRPAGAPTAPRPTSRCSPPVAGG